MREINQAAATSARMARNRHNPKQNFLASDGDRYAQEQAGIAGEVEAARVLGLDPFPIRERTKLKGANFVLSDGRRMQVCTARKAPLYLPVEQSKIDAADIFVLAHHDEKTGKTRCLGWATAGEIKASGRLGKLVSGPKAPTNYLLHVNVLREMETLIAQCRPTQASLW